MNCYCSTLTRLPLLKRYNVTRRFLDLATFSTDANKRWLDNAEAISSFLSKANHNWAFGDMKIMMHDHLQLITNEAMARIKKD